MLDILYEDEDVIILNKPAGICVHPAKQNIEEKSLISEIIKYFPQIKNVGEDPLRPGIVHRLDKETSGILVVAKNQKSFLFLKEQFQKRAVVKNYIALAVGKMPKKEGEINFLIGRSKKFGKFAARILSKKDLSRHTFGREAITYWKLIKEYRDKDGNILSLLKIIPKTGRTHQIRVHLASIGHPVVGDKLYGGESSKKYRELLNRHFLHAAFIELSLPSGGRIRVETDLPQELQSFLSKLNS
jgi:23S rRNA pseudouridine1911/1915/1917 synthase